MGKSHRDRTGKHRPLFTVIYAIAVLVLVVCIGYFYHLSDQQSGSFEAEKARLQSEEEILETTAEEETEMMKSLEEALDSDS
ncbi:MAG: hypothetical protein LIP10_11605 [Clostridiales bacterium]|nr:hypothetical protein [Clostridiales bacterium]